MASEAPLDLKAKISKQLQQFTQATLGGEEFVITAAEASQLDKGAKALFQIFHKKMADIDLMGAPLSPLSCHADSRLLAYYICDYFKDLHDGGILTELKLPLSDIFKSKLVTTVNPFSILHTIDSIDKILSPSGDVLNLAGDDNVAVMESVKEFLTVVTQAIGKLETLGDRRITLGCMIAFFNVMRNSSVFDAATKDMFYDAYLSEFHDWFQPSDKDLPISSFLNPYLFPNLCHESLHHEVKGDDLSAVTEYLTKDAYRGWIDIALAYAPPPSLDEDADSPSNGAGQSFGLT